MSRPKQAQPAKPLPTIIVDTREQHPYSFAAESAHTVVRKLDSGDYSLLGHEDEIAVERKSLADFVGSVITDRARFFRELERLRSYAQARVVIEASVEDVLAARYRSHASPAAVLGAAFSIETRMRIPIVWAGDRPHAREWVERWLLYCWAKGAEVWSPAEQRLAAAAPLASEVLAAAGHVPASDSEGMSNARSGASEESR